jgi:conjugal transfer pilus assembly protein TraB
MSTTPRTPPQKKVLSRAGKRQLVLLAAIGFLLLAVVMLAMKVSESNAPPPRQPKTKVETTRLNAPGALSEETVAAVNDRRFAELQANTKALELEREKRLREVQEKAEQEAKKAAERAGSSGNAGDVANDPGATRSPPKLFDASKMGDDFRPRAGSSARSDGTPVDQAQAVSPPPVTTLEFSATQPSAPSQQEQSAARPLLNVGPDARANYEAVGRALRSGGSVNSQAGPSLFNRAEPAPQKADTYLPTGTFFRVSTMNGIDAPAGGLAQQNPQPVLMVVSDWGNMPNAFRADVKHCFVIGSAWGDLSAERAMARTESLSCVRPNGDVIDVPIAGFVVGPDGRNGFRGRVVSKQGQVLANALWVGMLGSFGDVAKQVNSTPVVIAGTLATQQTPSTSDVLRRSALGGAGESAKSLAQYYITLADKLYPVVEVNGGQSAEVVLTRGVAVKESQRVGSSADLVQLSSSIQRLMR